MSDLQSSETDNSLLSNATSDCITFDSEERVITITCKTTDLTQIDSALKDPNILQRDANIDKGWILNSGITVVQNAILYLQRYLMANFIADNYLDRLNSKNNQIGSNGLEVLISSCLKDSMALL